jgi:hypothetical protein
MRSQRTKPGGGCGGAGRPALKPALRVALEQRRPEIRARWEALLRLEKEPSPLGNPRGLVFLFDQTLNEVLGPVSKSPVVVAPTRPACRCECNPFRHYFAALEQALIEALVWAQSGDPALTREEKFSSVDELSRRLRAIAQREMLLLDSLCRRAVSEPREA